ncbi:MAG TPA: hypothetical protein VHG91_16155 [Longimicrobium sp.]|nr:hypothetical protein [Longimicrobium sp.]
MTQDSYFGSLQKALSHERFAAYRRPGCGDVEALANYLWNTALCEALYPAVQGLEVALRNTLFDAGEAAFADRAAREAPCWLDAYPPVLLPGEAARVEQAKRGLRSRQRALEPGRIVAELSFGFWTALFDVRYETSRILWPRLFKHGVFTGAPRRLRTRGTLSPMLNRVRLLRNRAFHHESIWHWRDLAEQHALTLELLGWVSPALRGAVELVDRFGPVHRDGPAAFRACVRALPPFYRVPEVAPIHLPELTLAAFEAVAQPNREIR